MSGTVVQFPGPGREIDQILTGDVEIIRRRVGFEYKSNLVRASNMHAGYLPWVLEDGEVQLGEMGIKDFEIRFASVDIHSAELLVMFTTALRALEARRDSSLDPGFQQALGELAVFGRKTGILPANKTQRTSEDRLLGYAASHYAIDTLSRIFEPRAIRERLAARVRVAAGAKLPKLRTVDAQTERSRTIKHFTSTYPRLKPELLQIVQSKTV